MIASPAQHRLGLTLAALAATAWSTGGLFVRAITTDLMTMLFWRGIFSCAAVFAIFFILERRRAVAILMATRWPAILVACASAMSMICGIGSIRFTTVAEAMIIYALLPFITAGLAWLVIGERPSRAAALASGAALAGVAIMFWNAQSGGSLFGKLLAFGMASGMAVSTVTMRQHREIVMLPAMGGASLICAFVTFWFAAPWAVGTHDFQLIVLFGIFQSAAGLVLYTLGARRIAAAEATLMASLEVPFTPLLVWLFMDETPSVPVLIGGAIVLTALFGYILHELRRSLPAKPAEVKPTLAGGGQAAG